LAAAAAAAAAVCCSSVTVLLCAFVTNYKNCSTNSSSWAREERLLLRNELYGGQRQQNWQ
jgi:hypothetical protein